jgi:hypothetical protein
LEKLVRLAMLSIVGAFRVSISLTVTIVDGENETDAVETVDEELADTLSVSAFPVVQFGKVTQSLFVISTVPAAAVEAPDIVSVTPPIGCPPGFTVAENATGRIWFVNVHVRGLQSENGT